MALITFTQHGTAAAVCQWVCKTLPGVKRRLAGSSLSTLFSLSLSQCVWCVTTVVVVMHKKVVKGMQKKNALE